MQIDLGYNNATSASYYDSYQPNQPNPKINQSPSGSDLFFSAQTRVKKKYFSLIRRVTKMSEFSFTIILTSPIHLLKEMLPLLLIREAPKGAFLL